MPNSWGVPGLQTFGEEQLAQMPSYVKLSLILIPFSHLLSVWLFALDKKAGKRLSSSGHGHQRAP